MVGQNVYGKGIMKKKMDQIAHFWPEWWFKLFTSAYRGSPPPAVFQNKYQSYKYERNTAGKYLGSAAANISSSLFCITNIKVTNIKEIQQGNIWDQRRPI